MTLLDEIAAFDGKHIAPLEDLAARLSPDPQVIRELIGLARRDDPLLQAAATWLLKRLQEGGAAFSEPEVEALLDLLDQVADWEARLHLLQILPVVQVPEGCKEDLHRLLGRSLRDENKFVRAWSYTALAELAAQFADLRDEVAERLRLGQRDEAASVRARIRNVLKTHPWLFSA